MERKAALAIVPARGGSKGIHRKNLVDVGGSPLVYHSLRQARQCPSIDLVVLSTEDPEIRAVGESKGFHVVGRKKEFIHDNSVQEVDRLLQWTVCKLEADNLHFDVIVLLYPTAPLRSVDTIEKAVRMVVEEGYDSVLSVYEDPTYLWRRDGDVGSPVNYDPRLRGPRQKEEWNQWAENKAIYVMTRDLIVNTGCRLGGRIGFVEMSKWESIDIDTPDDLALVRILLNNKNASMAQDRDAEC